MLPDLSSSCSQTLPAEVGQPLHSQQNESSASLAVYHSDLRRREPPALTGYRVTPEQKLIPVRFLQVCRGFYKCGRGPAGGSTEPPLSIRGLDLRPGRIKRVSSDPPGSSDQWVQTGREGPARRSSRAGGEALGRTGGEDPGVTEHLLMNVWLGFKIQSKNVSNMKRHFKELLYLHLSFI